MKNKRPILKWITVTAVLLLAGLIYAVYFTELGRPIETTSKTDRPITVYKQTAVPTLFVQWRPIPIVALAWAHADQNFLKFTIVIQGLEANWNPADWVCNPYINVHPPVPRRLSGYQMETIYDSSGEAVQATYEYEIDADDHDSLAIDMDMIIGPCADYWNFQESNATPEDIPELVGKYHLSFQVPVRRNIPPASLSSTPASAAIVIWRDLPIFPGGIESNDTTADQPVYHYIIEDTDPDAIQDFYESEMQVAGWELLGIADTGLADIGKALWFAKDQDIVTIGVFEKEGLIHVWIRLE